jgi:hypothetical protein
MRARPRLVALVIVALLVACASRKASAQSAEAQELFDEGRKALAAGDYAKACLKLDASERIERAVGTLLSLAECEHRLGRLASERLHLQEAASWADATHDPLNRGPLARKRFAEIDLRVPRLTLRRAAGAPAASHVTRDDVDLGASAFDAALPVDAGRHVIVVSAPGRASATYEVTLNEGELRVLEVGPGAGETPPSPTTNGLLGWSRRTWAYALGGTGAAGLAVGSVFGVLTLSTWGQAKRDCGSGCAQGSTARGEAGQAQTDATISTVAFVVGGLAVAAGAYLFFTAPPDGGAARGLTVSPWVAAGGGGASMGGTWQ